MQIARGVIGLVVTGHYPLNHHPGRLAIEHLEQYCFGWKEISQWFSYLQSILFVASTTAVAIVVRPMSPLASLCLDPQCVDQEDQAVPPPLHSSVSVVPTATAAAMGSGPLCLSTCLDGAQQRRHFRPMHLLQSAVPVLAST